MIIVYCRKCGTALRRPDFEKDRARVVDGSPYCRPCDPVEEFAPRLRRRRGRALRRF